MFLLNSSRLLEHSNNQEWDLLLWGNHDWFKHPWAAFFVYRPFCAWSTIPPNDFLSQTTNDLFKVNVESEAYPKLIAKLLEYVYHENLMLYLPTPHNVFAVNKQVIFNPGKSAYVYLRDIEVSPYHWSVRGDKPLPQKFTNPFKIKRLNY